MTDFLIKLSEKMKFFWLFYLVWCAFWFIFNMINYDRELIFYFITHLVILILSFIVWFGIKIMLKMQINNSYCKEGFFNFFSLVLIVTSLSSTISGIATCLEGSIYGIYFFPLIGMSAINVQKYRKDCDK